MNPNEKDPSVVYKHYHEQGKILPLYDNSGRIAGFQFPLIDNVLPMSPPSSTFRKAPHGEISQDPTVAQNPLVKYTLSEYKINTTGLRFAGSYYKGMDNNGDEWVRIAVRDKVDLNKLQKYPHKIVFSFINVGLVLSVGVVLTYLSFFVFTDMDKLSLFALIAFLLAGFLLLKTYGKMLLLKKIESGPEPSRVIDIEHMGWISMIPGFFMIIIPGIIYVFENEATGAIWAMVVGFILCLSGWFLWKFDIVQSVTDLPESAEGIEDIKTVPEEITTDESIEKEEEFLLPAALENLGEKDHIKQMDVVNLIKNLSEKEQMTLIRAIPFQELRLDQPGQWTNRHERLFRFCLRYSGVLMNYDRIRSEHPAYGLPDLSSLVLHNFLIQKLVQHLSGLQAELIPIEAGERLLRWANDLYYKKYTREARQCVSVLKRIRSGRNPQFLQDVDRLEKEMAASKARKKVAPVTGTAKSLSVSEPQTVADLHAMVERKLDLLTKRHLKPDTFTGYEAFYADLKKELNSVEQLIIALERENTFIVAAASEALGEIVDSTAVGPLIDVINRESDLMNWALPLEKAIQALGRIGDPQAIAPLTKKLEHDDGDVRTSAKQAIDTISKKQGKALGPAEDDITGRDKASEESASIEDVYSKFSRNMKKHEIVARYDLLEENTGIMFNKAEGLLDIIPQNFLQKCRFLYEKNKYNILENILECELLTRPGNYGYTDEENKLYFVVSPMPWTKQEAIENFRQISNEPPYGYVNQFTNLINGRPSPELTNFLQFLFCMGGGMFELHVCMAQMRSESPKDGYHFTIYPLELLNDEEQRQGNL